MTYLFFFFTFGTKMSMLEGFFFFGTCSLTKCLDRKDKVLVLNHNEREWDPSPTRSAATAEQCFSGTFQSNCQQVGDSTTSEVACEPKIKPGSDFTPVVTFNFQENRYD